MVLHFYINDTRVFFFTLIISLVNEFDKIYIIQVLWMIMRNKVKNKKCQKVFIIYPLINIKYYTFQNYCTFVHNNEHIKSNYRYFYFGKIQINK